MGRDGAAAGKFQDFCQSTLYECITQEKPAALQAYIFFYTLLEALLSPHATSSSPESSASGTKGCNSWTQEIWDTVVKYWQCG